MAHLTLALTFAGWGFFVGRHRYSTDTWPMYNEADKLPQLQKTTTTATLGLVDGTDTLSFLCNPEKIDIAHRQTRNPLNVLGTSNGLSVHQYSQTSYTLPQVRFWTPANDRDLTTALQTLEGWTQFPGPVLAFALGSIGLERCYLSEFTYTVDQHRAGKPTQATGMMVLTPAPAAIEAERAQPDVVELTTRERENYVELLVEAFPDATQWVVEKDGTLLVDGIDLGNALVLKDELEAGTVAATEE